MKGRSLRIAFGAIASVLAFCTPAQAQQHYRPHISVGAHGGMSMAQMAFSPSVKQTWNQGLYAGLRLRYSEERLFGLVGELNVVQRGWKERFDPPVTLRYSRTLTYISLPVMTQISFGTRRFKGIVNLGPEVSYMIGSSISSDFDYAHPAENPSWPSEQKRMTEQMAMPAANKFDYGITAGIGMEWYVRPRHSVTLEARYYYGLGNIYPSAKRDVLSASRCTDITVSIGYYFRLK